MVITVNNPQWVEKLTHAFTTRISVTMFLTFFSTLLAITATIWALSNDAIVAYGDAESHLNISKRVIHALTPGASQLGGIWLPIPHIMMLPFIWSDFLWRTGLAGSIVSGICYVISTVALYRTMLMLTSHKTASVVAALIFACNPNVLYMQSTPMTELPLIMFLILSTYYFSRFLANDKDMYALITAGFFGFCATLSRYDGWFLVLFQGLIILLMYITKKDGWKHIFGKGLLFGSVGLFGILLWVMWGWLILGDPLYFTNSEFSAKSQQEAWNAKGQLPAYHNLGQSILYYTVTAASNTGVLLFLTSLIGFVVYMRTSKNAHKIFIGILMLVPYIFNIVTLYIGQSVIFIPHVTPVDGFEWRLFNVRYGMMMIPFAALMIGYLWTQVKTNGKLLIVTLSLIQILLFASGFSPVMTFADGTVGLSKAKRPDAERWIKENYDGGLILMDDFARSISIVRSGIPMQNSIYIGTKPYWEESFAEPERHATWIVAQKDDAVWKEIIDNPEKSGRLYAYFNKVYTSPDTVIFRRIENKISPGIGSENETGTFWKYQCIDTMKTSRDRAQELLKISDAQQIIDQEVRLVAESGATCIAIATPYDDEFVPLLKMWVQSARQYKLHVWFRGNFSAWEGWFGRKKGMTTAEHITATSAFILKYPELFQDEDIFTAAPEAENGGPFTGTTRDEFPLMREFLIQKKQAADTAFAQINKNVVTNWFSMNGWIGRNMYDEVTLDKTGRRITIDHYTTTVEKMDEDLEDYKENINAEIVLGEFGAPIPDLNGSLTAEEQAEFVEGLFKVSFLRRDQVRGLNYWTLRGGSTAIVDDNYNPKPAYEIIQNYYQPGIIEGEINDIYGKPIERAKVSFMNNDVNVLTDKLGHYAVILPAGNHDGVITKEGFNNTEISTSLDRGGVITLDSVINPEKPSIIDRLWLWVKEI